jgi:RNA polymerase sigma factor (sigma-70 family)
MVGCHQITCNTPTAIAHLTTVSASKTRPEPGGSSGKTVSEFEAVYRAHVGAVSRFLARRSTDPQVVADLTSETFVRAMSSIHTFEGRGSLRAWLLAIARAVYAQQQEALADGRQVFDRLSGQVMLQDDESEDLVDRIDAERAGRELLERITRLPELERSAIELVVLEGMTSREAARVLKVSPGAVRVRLLRARARLRKGAKRL